MDVQLIRSDKTDPTLNEEAFAYLRISVLDPDPKKVALLSTKLVELALASIPGFTATAPPSKGTPAIMHWPALIPSRHIQQTVHVDGEMIIVDSVSGEKTKSEEPEGHFDVTELAKGETIAAPFGRAFATRSGDKGGNANLGIWARTPEAFAFLHAFLTTDKLKELLGDLKGYEIERYELPNLLAINFYIKGLLGDGVAASLKSDPQAKTLGEYLRAKMIEMPQAILPE
jgi:hypothetical protein